MSSGGQPRSPTTSGHGKEASGAGEARLTVLYDGRCRVCTRVAARLAGLDTGHRLRFVPLQRATRDRPEVQRLRAQRDLRRALHVVDEDGRWASGGEAVLRTAEHVPRLRPLARAARLPGVAALVEPAYRLVAQHRARLAWLAGDFPLGVVPSDPGSAAARRSGAAVERRAVERRAVEHRGVRRPGEERSREGHRPGPGDGRGRSRG